MIQTSVMFGKGTTTFSGTIIYRHAHIITTKEIQHWLNRPKDNDDFPVVWPCFFKDEHCNPCGVGSDVGVAPDSLKVILVRGSKHSLFSSKNGMLGWSMFLQWLINTARSIVPPTIFGSSPMKRSHESQGKCPWCIQVGASMPQKGNSCGNQLLDCPVTGSMADQDWLATLNRLLCHEIKQSGLKLFHRLHLAYVGKRCVQQLSK